MEVINACMNGHFDIDDEDTSDFLESYKCFRVASAENINEIIFSACPSRNCAENQNI